MTTQSIVQKITGYAQLATKVSSEINEVLDDTNKLLSDLVERAQIIDETLTVATEQSLDITIIVNEIIQKELNSALEQNLNKEKVEIIFTGAVNKLDLDPLTETLSDSKEIIDDIREKVHEFMESELVNLLPGIESNVVELKQILFDTIKSQIGLKLIESTQDMSNILAERVMDMIDKLTKDIHITIEQFKVDTNQDESQSLQAAIDQLEPAFEAVKLAIDELTQAAEPFGITV